MNDKMKKILPFLMIGIILVCGCTYLYKESVKKRDSNTCSTVAISGTRMSDTADTYYDQQECRKGDQISIGSLTLLVTRVDKKGTLSFEVKHGELANESGETIQSDELKLDEQKNYKSGNDRFSLRVVSKKVG